MNRSTHPAQLQNTEYPFCYNCNTENEVGETFNVVNEPSNYYSVKFPQGYKVIGYEKHPTKEQTYFFLTNPETGYSSIGLVQNNIVDLTFEQDTEVICEDCEYFEETATPLEDITQIPYSDYKEYFNDLCNKDLNFSIDHPIKHVEIKIDKLGTTLYWVDAYNPDRFFIEDNLEDYKYIGEIICGVDNRIPTCVNVQKMLQQPIYSTPIITPEVLQTGGNLRMGTYEFILAYCDQQGNEISNYTSITQPISIFDENNRILTQPELDSFTNFGIRLSVEQLDTTFQFYKVVVIERVSVNQAESYFIEGIHSTSDNSIFYTSTQTGTESRGSINQRITLDRINARKPLYEHTAGIESSNKQLFKWGITGKKFPNLQPVVNLIGGFLKWNSSVAKESIYKNAIATSKYKGYMREEVQPFAIKFFNKDGSEYPVMPLVPRPAKDNEVTLLDPQDKNLKSVLDNSSNCTSSDRNKVWQVYNTATVEGTCSNYGDQGEEVVQEEISECTVINVDTLENSSINVVASTEIDSLEEYINTNRLDIINPSSDKYLPTIASYLTAEYPEAVCYPNVNENCSDPELDSYYVQVQEVSNEQYSTVYDEVLTDYSRNQPPASCQPYAQDFVNGGFLKDEGFQTDYMLTTVYKRAGNFFNEVCANAVTVINNNDPQQPAVSYYNNYYGALTQAALIDASKVMTTTNTNFLSGLHKGAIWFKIDKNNRDKILFEITNNSECNQSDDIPEINQLRYSIFESCSSTNPLQDSIISTITGEFAVLDISSYPDTFFVAVEAPIVTTDNLKYRTAPPCGCFSVLTRDLIVTETTISFDSMVFEKINTYKSDCTYVLPQINDCDPVPYQYGDFSYWESIETYPDNEELYNSSSLNISRADILNLSPFQITTFENYYTDNSTDINYVLNENTDLRCKPIKQYKFPSNIISPFMSTNDLLPFSESLIYPLGVSIDNNVINTFLNIAVKNNILTQKQRDEIAGYGILRGDNTVHKSVVANTIGFDMYKYQEKGSEVLYPNYPLNDLGNDLLHMENGADIPHPYNGTSNFNFSLLGAQLSVSRPTLATEAIISGYQIGDSRIQFNEVEGHPKWVLLTNTANNTATALAIAEVALEIAIKIADYTVQGTSSQWYLVLGGTSSGAGASTGLAGTALGLGLLSVIQAVTGFIKVGQYRLQWLRTIRDLGQPRNYTSYCTAEGYTNSFITNPLNFEQLRGLSVAKYLKPGRRKVINEKTGQALKINNINREDSAFISFGQDYPIIYPLSYSGYDNNTLSSSNGSRTIVSQNGGEQGEESDRRCAMPYITLKNYIPNQFGTLDSIQWLSTSYRSYLSEDTTCKIIFGGTVFISRDVQERKIPIFRTDALNQADLTAFNYSRYKNVGKPHYYIDYETGGSTSGIGSILFPTINSDYTLDNVSKSDFYFREASKFYLYYYGFASYLVESEVNTNFRYGGRNFNEQYFPDIQSDIVEFTQQKNRSIKIQPTYFYNSVYSRPVTKTPYTTLPVTYKKEIYDKINDAPNGVIYSLPDNSENDITDPWLIYRPLNKGEFESKHGKLISLTDLGSETLLARFENREILLNSIDNLANETNPILVELGTGGVFSKRGIESPFGGSQNTDIIVSKYGAFSVDAKRGEIYQRLGQEITPISDVLNGQPSGMKNWFREHLPYKLLKHFPEADIDNKFKSIGISMGLDAKQDRIFITKKDYTPKSECIEYDKELGFVLNETQCSGQEPEITCAEGYTYNPDTELCEKETVISKCPVGYTYNAELDTCIKLISTPTEPCPPYFGYNTGGVFTTPDARIANSEINLPNITTGGVRFLKRDNQGRILVAGIFSSIGGQPVTGLARLNVNGTIDPTFDTGTGFAGGTQSLQAIDVYLDGRILIGGNFESYQGHPAQRLVRIMDNGDYDASFNTASGFTGTSAADPRDIRIVENNKILIATANSTYKGQFTKGLIKILDDASIDPTFGGGNRFKSFIFSGGINGNTNGDQGCESIEVDSLGRYIIGGRFVEYNGVLSRKIVRIYPSGDLDTNFVAADGFTYTGVPDTFNYFIDKVQMQGDKILAAGRFDNYQGFPAQGIVRLLANGDLDTTFNNNKIIDGSGSITDKIIYDFDTDSAGEILIGGNYQGYDGNGIAYITLTDVNGFPIDFDDPGYNGLIQTVLNTPRCNNCEQPCYTSVVQGQTYCNCEEYVPAKQCGTGCEDGGQECNCIETQEPVVKPVLRQIELTDENYFKSYNWTVAFKPLEQSWVSYYSFKPDYYLNYNSEFFTGYNTSEDLWVHPLNLKSFGVFNGVRQPFIVEQIISSENVQKLFNSISVTTEVKRWKDDWDYSLLPLFGFNKGIVYNNNNNSNLLEFVKQETLSDIRKYPQINGSAQQILYTNEQLQNSFNYFYNRVINYKNNVPLFLQDENMILKEINPKSVSFKGKKVLERIRGEWMIVRLINDSESRYAIVIQKQINNETVI